MQVGFLIALHNSHDNDFLKFMDFNAEAQRTPRTAEEIFPINSAHLHVLCASALNFFCSLGLLPSKFLVPYSTSTLKKLLFRRWLICL